jgi:polysaccharide biosynthesis transport protein
MNPSQFLAVLYARRGLIFLLVVLSALTALAVGLITPKSYKATTSLVVNYTGTDPVTGLSYPSQLMPGFMATQVDIIKNMTVALGVVDDLRLAEGPAAVDRFQSQTDGKGDIREWYARQLLTKLEVAPSRESSVLTISFSAPDAHTAANVANAFSDAYQDMSVRLRVDPSRKAAVYFNEQIKSLRDKFETAQRKVTAFQQESGIISPDHMADVETKRLNELSNQLALVQAQALEASSRRTQATGRGAAESPDVAGNPLVQNLRTQLASAETAFAGLASRLTPQHPRYREAKAEVDKLRNDLNAAIGASSITLSNNARILERHEQELRAAVEAQKVRVLEANNQRAELKMLNNEMETAQRSYETAAQRFMQANFEGQANLADISVLTAALAPSSPASPKVARNVLFAVVLGLMLGIGLALFAEALDRRVRSPGDLADVIEAPVFQMMNWQGPARRRLAMPATLLGYNRGRQP